jgi:hypothetical protein
VADTTHAPLGAPRAASLGAPVNGRPNGHRPLDAAALTAPVLPKPLHERWAMHLGGTAVPAESPKATDATRPPCSGDEFDAGLARAARRAGWMRQGFYLVVLVVAMAGQVTGAVEALHIPLVAAIPAVVALELGGVVVLQNADVRRRLGERATASRLLSVAIAAWAVAFNWLAHANHLLGGFYAGMSALGYLVWLMHTENQRRDRLRAKGDLPPTTPAYELWAHWLCHPWITMRAKSLAKANTELGLYDSIAAARAELHRERRTSAISKVLHRKIRSAVDPTTADIAVGVYDLDQVAARLAQGADYDGLTGLVAVDLQPERLAITNPDDVVATAREFAAQAAAAADEARVAEADATALAEAATARADVEEIRRRELEAALADVEDRLAGELRARGALEDRLRSADERADGEHAARVRLETELAGLRATVSAEADRRADAEARAAAAAERADGATASVTDWHRRAVEAEATADGLRRRLADTDRQSAELKATVGTDGRGGRRPEPTVRRGPTVQTDGADRRPDTDGTDGTDRRPTGRRSDNPTDGRTDGHSPAAVANAEALRRRWPDGLVGDDGKPLSDWAIRRATDWSPGRVKLARAAYDAGAHLPAPAEVPSQIDAGQDGSQGDGLHNPTEDTT